MSMDENKAMSQRLYEEVFGRGNLGAADEVLDPACVSHGQGSPPLVGTDQIKRQATLLKTALPDLQLILNDQFAENDRVVSRWTCLGTHTGPLTLRTGTLAATGRQVYFDEIRKRQLLRQWPHRRIVVHPGSHDTLAAARPTSGTRCGRRLDTSSTRSRLSRCLRRVRIV